MQRQTIVSKTDELPALRELIFYKEGQKIKLMHEPHINHEHQPENKQAIMIENAGSSLELRQSGKASLEREHLS